MDNSSTENCFDITQIFDEDVKDLPDVLKHPRFVQSVRTGQQKLTFFLTKDDNLKTLMKIVLTNEYDKNIYNEKAINNTMLFFTSNSYSNNEIVRENPIFKEYLRGFQNSKYTQNPEIAGHFQRIVDSVARQTSCQYLNNFTGLHDFLIDNIDIFAYRELFVTLSTSFIHDFGVDKNLILKLLSSINGKQGFNIVGAMKHMIKLKREIITMFDDETVIETLLKAAVEPNHKLLTFEIFRVVEKILNSSNNNAVQDVINKYSDIFDFNEHKDGFVRAAAISVFLKFPHELIESIFDDKPYSLLNESIIHAVNAMSDQELIEMNNKYNLVNRIIEKCKKGNVRSNAHIWELGELLRKVKEINSEEWSKFVINRLEPHLHLRDGSYGGERPNEEILDVFECQDVPTHYIPPAFPNISDSDSSDTSSDEDDDIGGYENAKYFAKEAGMEDLFEYLDEQQKRHKKQE